MPPELTAQDLAYLLDAAGLTLTDAQKQDLKTIHPPLAAMKARVRQPRRRMAKLNALDGTLWALFERWYPGFANNSENEAAQATAA